MGVADQIVSSWLSSIELRNKAIVNLFSCGKVRSCYLAFLFSTKLVGLVFKFLIYQLVIKVC